MREQLVDATIGMHRQSRHDILEMPHVSCPCIRAGCARLMVMAARWPASSLTAEHHALRLISRRPVSRACHAFVATPDRTFRAKAAEDCQAAIADEFSRWRQVDFATLEINIIGAV